MKNLPFHQVKFYGKPLEAFCDLFVSWKKDYFALCRILCHHVGISGFNPVLQARITRADY